MRALVALRLILGVGGHNAVVAQSVVVSAVGDAGERLFQLEEGLGTAGALWSLARFVHADECDGR